MRLTIIGSGDAFGSGGRFNTCFLIETPDKKVLLDFGASSLVALKARQIDPNSIDGIILSHLHGDHFGGLPFLLLDAQFLARRERPLAIVRSTRHARAARRGAGSFLPALQQDQMALCAGGERNHARCSRRIFGARRHHRRSRALLRRALDRGAALRRPRRRSPIPATPNGPTRCLTSPNGADLFICECYDYERDLTGHMSWPTLQSEAARAQCAQNHDHPHEPEHAREARRSPRRRPARGRRRADRRNLKSSAHGRMRLGWSAFRQIE